MIDESDAREITSTPRPSVPTTEPSTPQIVIDHKLDRDLALMHTLTVRCCDCRVVGPLMSRRWSLVNGACFCSACAVAE
jgi:hypothetical protein